MKNRFGVVVLGIFLNLINTERVAAAGEPTVESQFQSGQFEGSFGGGFFVSPFVTHLDAPMVDYTLTEFELGCMLTDPRGRGILHGNLECAGEAFGGAIFRGQGNYVAGGTFWLRYNFVRPAGRFVPYAELGAGAGETDLDRRIEGQNFNFNLDLGVGARYFVSSNWSVNLEYRYQHISNGGMSRHNVGVNADGPVLSISRFF